MTFFSFLYVMHFPQAEWSAHFYLAVPSECYDWNMGKTTWLPPNPAETLSDRSILLTSLSYQLEGGRKSLFSFCLWPSRDVRSLGLRSDSSRVKTSRRKTWGKGNRLGKPSKPSRQNFHCKPDVNLRLKIAWKSLSSPTVCWKKWFTIWIRRWPKGLKVDSACLQ